MLPQLTPQEFKDLYLGSFETGMSKIPASDIKEGDWFIDLPVTFSHCYESDITEFGQSVLVYQSESKNLYSLLIDNNLVIDIDKNGKRQTSEFFSYLQNLKYLTGKIKKLKAYVKHYPNPEHTYPSVQLIMELSKSLVPISHSMEEEIQIGIVNSKMAPPFIRRRQSSPPTYGTGKVMNQYGYNLVTSGAGGSGGVCQFTGP